MQKTHDPESTAPQTEFEEAGQEQQVSLMHEFLLFVCENKKWWLTPILLAFALLGMLIMFGSTGAAPFIYTLF